MHVETEMKLRATTAQTARRKKILNQLGTMEFASARWLGCRKQVRKTSSQVACMRLPVVLIRGARRRSLRGSKNAPDAIVRLMQE